MNQLAKWIVTGLLAVIGLVPSAVRLHAMDAPPARNQHSDDVAALRPPELEHKAPALLQLGTDNLRTRGFITDIAFSPDGKLIAAAGMSTPVPTLWLFDVETGTAVKRISPADKPSGWIQCLAFSPDPSQLAWGEMDGHIALWDLAMDRVVWHEKLHQGRVNDVAFSPNGELLASCADDGNVELRRVADPTQAAQSLAVGKGPGVGAGTGGGLGSSGGCSLAFTPDGTRLVVGSAATAEISIWRIRDGKLLRRIPESHGNSAGRMNPSLNSVAVTPDGRRIISSGQRTVPIGETKLKYGPKNVTMTEIRVWDIKTGKRQRDLNGDDDHGFGHAALSRDGKRVAVGDFGLLRILGVETGRTEQSISLPGSSGHRPEFSPDGNLVAMPIDNTIGLFEVSTGRRLHHRVETPAGMLVSAAWSPSGDRLVTGHTDGGVRVWEAATGKLLWHKLLAPVISPSGWNANPVFVVFSADGYRIVVAGRRDDPMDHRNGIVAIYEARSGRLIRSVDQQEIWNAGLSPDRQIVVVATSHGSADDTHLIGIEVETGRTLFATPPENVPGGFEQMKTMQFRPNSTMLLLAAGNGDVIEFDGVTGKEQRRFVADFRTPEQIQAGRPSRPQMWNGAFSADGKTLVSSSAEFVYVWNVETGKMRRKIRHPHAKGCFVCVAPDGKTAATSDVPHAMDYGEDSIRLFNLETGKQIMTIEPKDNRAGVLVFSPDGTKLFTGYYRSSATVWDVRQ